MENWLIRIVAGLCAAGSSALFWTLGVFIALPWREGRLLALSAVELQLIVVPLLLGSAVSWGALHIVAIADRQPRPRLYAATCALLLIANLAALFAGCAWTQARFA